MLCETCSRRLQRGVRALRAFRSLRCRGRLHAVVHAQRRKQNKVACHQAGGDNNSREDLYAFRCFGLHALSMRRWVANGEALFGFQRVRTNGVR